MTNRDLLIIQQMIKDRIEDSILYDFLQDADAHIGEILELFAGMPPYWINGIRKGVLDLWLSGQDTNPGRTDDVIERGDFAPAAAKIIDMERHLDGTTLPAQTKCQPRYAGAITNNIDNPSILLPCPLHQSGEKITLVRLQAQFQFPGSGETMFGQWPIYIGYCHHCAIRPWLALAPAWHFARLWKRGVLSQFPEVLVRESKACQCREKSSPFLDPNQCQRCNGSSAYHTGKMIPANNLIQAV